MWSAHARAAEQRTRVVIEPVGPVPVGSAVRAAIRGAPGAPPSAARYAWLLCDWNGDTCKQIAKGRALRVPTVAVGHVLRAQVAVLPGAPLQSDPSPIVIPVNQKPIVAAAGDIACDPTSPSFKNGAGTALSCKQAAVSDLVLAHHPTAVLTLGDTQYECGDASAFGAAFDPSWGRMKAIIHPAVGNHEYGKPCHRNDASPYFAYFGAEAGPRGWYSYTLGPWHVVALNSECSYGTGGNKVGGCGAGSPEETWLRHDLVTHPSRCTLAYWHEPRFSSGEHGDAFQMGTIWNDLVAAHVDVVLSGHNHDYERFDPIGATPVAQGAPVPMPSGIREFVVGTGGRNLYPFSSPPLPDEVLRSSEFFGALFLTLGSSGYSWQFLPISGDGHVADEGSGACH
jgi:hypothetical protein